MEVVRKTVPSSGSGVTKAALSEPGSAPRLGVGGGRRRRRRKCIYQIG